MSDIDTLRAVLTDRLVERGDAVNLASNMRDYGIQPTDKGVRLLAEAVLRMDAALRELQSKPEKP